MGFSFNLHASLSLCLKLGAVCLEGGVCFDGGACVCAVTAMAVSHGNSEGVCVLQFHLVLLRHPDEGTPSKGATKTCAEPAESDRTQ